ncbi:MAG: hypothetical protein IPK73_31285 [Candidatus Obscuribacter sp.]|nr:hypothetical protein [Candidatus Obscuribacter sp.]MBK9281455.1 hypothetical protein [Candidatus Obscuribacter sp.]
MKESHPQAKAFRVRGCYSRRLEEAFPEDYPKEKKHAPRKKSDTLSTTSQPPAAGSRQSSTQSPQGSLESGILPGVQDGSKAPVEEAQD